MGKLPQIHSSHEQERTSYQALESLLPKNLFLLRSEDGGDYGVDKIIEVIEQGTATNIRSHVQVKSKKAVTKSGVFSYPVPITTLNYLHNSPNSLFLVYVESEGFFFWEWVNKIAQAFGNQKVISKKESQVTFSYRFTERLGVQELHFIHERLIRDATFVKGLHLETDPFNRILVTECINNPVYRDYLVMYAAGKYEKVIALVKEHRESSSDLNSLVALCYFHTYNYEEALKYILGAEANSQNTEYKKIRAAIMCEKGIHENNQNILVQTKALFLSIDPTSWNWTDFYNYGNALSALGEFDVAEFNYRRALDLEPCEAMVWKNLSNLFREREDYVRELEYLNKALSLNPELPEALICKGILLGRHLSEYDQAIELLENALEISKTTLLKNQHIYFWIAEFHRSLEHYEEALLKIDLGLLLNPGDGYLESLRLRTLLEASERIPKYNETAVTLLEQLVSQYPYDPRLRAEQLKVLGRYKTIDELMLYVIDAFATQDVHIEPDSIIGLEVSEIVFMLDNWDALHKFRKISDFCQLLFERFDVSISKAQKIEMKVNFLFSSLDAKVNSSSKNQLMPLFKEHALCLIALSESFAEMLVAGFETENTEIKSDLVTKIIVALPEVLLIEFSRQVGWISQKHGYSVDDLDELIEKSSLINEWFKDCVEPILKGVNNVLKLFPEE